MFKESINEPFVARIVTKVTLYDTVRVLVRYEKVLWIN